MDSFRTDEVQPLEPGRYNISVEGLRTFMPIFGNFDGENWEFEGTVKMMPNPVVWWYPNE